MDIPLLLDRYDHLPLECDGFTRVASYCLHANGIAHVVKQGSVSSSEGTIGLHYWIETAEHIIDYRLRMWLGKTMPHGVFAPLQSVTYRGRVVDFPVSPMMYHILAGGVPATM